MTTPVLELTAVSREYPGVRALRDVGFAIAPGEYVAVTGPSGSGKTTLLHLMGTLDRPTSGTVRVTGQDVAALGDRRLSALRATRIGFVFQRFHLAEHATAAENVADGLLYAGYAARERRAMAAEALDRVGLGHRGGARPPHLSGGERQRVAIARAVAGRPAIVLADEPTGNLDSATGATILDLLAGLNATGATIVMITHDAGVAARAPRQITLLDGRVTADTSRPSPHTVTSGRAAPPVDGAGPATGAPSRGEARP